MKYIPSEDSPTWHFRVTTCVGINFVSHKSKLSFLVVEKFLAQVWHVFVDFFLLSSDISFITIIIELILLYNSVLKFLNLNFYRFSKILLVSLRKDFLSVLRNLLGLWIFVSILHYIVLFKSLSIFGYILTHLSFTVFFRVPVQVIFGTS